MRRVDVIWSLGESWLECGGGQGEKSGGVKGAGVYVPHVNGGKRESVVSWWL